MGNTLIINLSTLTDYAAVMRVGAFMAAKPHEAMLDTEGNRIVNIRQSGKHRYTVTDYED